MFVMQPPTERVLGEDFCLAPSGTMREVKDCFYYVSLLSSLQAMLNFKEIRDQVILHTKVSWSSSYSDLQHT